MASKDFENIYRFEITTRLRPLVSNGAGDAIDLAAHLIAERGLGVPASHREVFEILSRANLITPDSAQAMSLMASLRNRIAHSYGDLDPVRMVRETPGGLDAATRFFDEIVRSTSAPA